jgi:hypothetical protein
MSVYILKLKSTVFWVVMPCSLLEAHQHSRVTYCLLLEGQGVSKIRNHQEAGSKQSLLLASFFLGLLFNLEDGGNMLHPVVGGFLQNYMVIECRRSCSS